MMRGNDGSWPYHLYEGRKPELQGSYVPCDANPCHVHGNSEIYATSPEEAYEKAHEHDDWGIADIADNDAGTMVSGSSEVSDAEPSVSGSEAAGNADMKAAALAEAIEDMRKANTETDVLAKAKDAADMIARKYGYDSFEDASKVLKPGGSGAFQQEMKALSCKMAEAMKKAAAVKKAAVASKKTALKKAATITKKTTPGKALKGTGDGVPKGDGHCTAEAAKAAYEAGLYVGGSPLVHYLPKSKQSDEGRNLVELAKQVFPGAVCAHEDIDGIQERTRAALAKGTKGEIAAVRSFTSNSYARVNQALRKGFDKDMDEEEIRETSRMIQDMHSFMHHRATAKVIDKDMVVFRRRFLPEGFADRGGEEKAFYKAVAKSMEDGGEPIVDRADFMSTTWQVPDDYGCGATGFVIKIPKGTRAVDVSGIGYHPTEKELLIDKGYRFKVVGIYENSKLIKKSEKKETEWSGQNPIICLELVPPKKRLRSRKQTSSQPA